MNKNKIIALGMAILGVAMIFIGVTGAFMLPPILTGVGFLLLTWHLL